MNREELMLQVIVFSLGLFYAFVYYVRVSEPGDLQAVSDQLLAYLTAMLTAAFAILPVPISDTTRVVYDFIQKLPANSLVVLSFDYSTSTVRQPNTEPSDHQGISCSEGRVATYHVCNP